MKILYIITQADGGGAQNYVLSLAKRFGGTIAAGSEAKQLFIEARQSGVPCVELRHLKRAINPLNDFLAAWEIRRLIETEKPDIVHLNSSKAGFLGSFASVGFSARGGSASGGKAKIIFTAHGFIFNEPMGTAKHNFYLALEKMASEYRDHIITVSDADKKSALNNNLISPQKISTIHNGIKTINFLGAEQAREFLKLPAQKIIVGAIANFYKTKGLDVLVEAAGKLGDQIKTKIQITVLGDGPEIKNLKLKIKNLRLDNTVRLLGKMPNAAQYLKAFDIFVMPSRKEGFPYALLEAMQAALPIISTNVGGIPEALGDSGMLIAAEDPAALSGGIKYLVNNPQKRQELSQLASQRSRLFTESKMLEETEKVYKKLI